MVGVQYLLTAACFLAFGFSLVMLLRWQLAFPEQPIPLIGRLFGFLPNGIILPELFTALGAMHGTIMVFRPVG